MNLFGNTAFNGLDKFFVGFDDQFDRIAKMHDDLTKNIPNYPPYNVKKIDENKFVIELAVAGFAKQDIEIDLSDNKMVIKGKVTGDVRESDFLWRGIAARDFTRVFALQDQMEVIDAEMLNGMLKVFLERIIPEHKKPKKVTVREGGEGRPKKETKQFLAETNT